MLTDPFVALSVAATAAEDVELAHLARTARARGSCGDRKPGLIRPSLAFRLLPEGFANRDLREHAAPLLGLSLDAYGTGRATYDLRRLRLRGLIEKVPFTHRYRVTEAGQRVALCYCRTHRRVLCPALAAVADDRSPPELGRLVRRFDRHVERLWLGRKLAA